MGQNSIDFNQIFRYAMLENTRMLFDFMQALSDRILENRENSDYKWEYIGYNGKGGLCQRQNLNGSLLKRVSQKLRECGVQSPYLKQNPLSAFLEFYDDYFGEGSLDFSSKSQRISYCLQYFNTLRYLADDHPVPTRSKDDLPYLYEDVCLSMREMTRCYAAYILYAKDGETAQLVSRSGYVVSTKEDETEPPRFIHELWDRLVSEILRSKKDPKEKNEKGAPEKKDEYKINVNKIVDDVYELRYIDTANDESKGYDYLAIVLPLDKKQEGEKIYIFLDCFAPVQEQTEDLDKKNLNAICKILFMRHRLLSCLKRDYAILLNFRYDCGYIKSVDEKTDGPKILHISDLHLEEKNKGILMDGIRSLPGFPQNGDRIDLLAITGDMVWASSNAAEAQQKYKMAAKFIRELAKRLWGYSKDGDDVCILPHDWKRRVLIVPGNHDYTTMSDVVVEVESRKIKAAFPANESAGTMSKLTYYIEFLADCLDVPIVEFVRNDMNEVRDYKNLNLKVGLFNTVAQSNSLQNNKVGFTQKEKLTDLLKRKEWLADKESPSYIVLSHHSPSYKINYFDDRYKFYNFDKIKPSGCKTNLGNELKTIWSKVSGSLADCSFSTESFCKAFAELRSSLDTGKNGVIHYLAEDSLSDKDYKDFSQSDFRHDLQKLDRILQKWNEWKKRKEEQGEPFSEFDHTFMTQWWSLAKNQTENQKSFDDVWNSLIKKDKLQMCLAGHEHEYCAKDNFYVEDQLYNIDHGDYHWSVHQILNKNCVFSEHDKVKDGKNMADYYLEGDNDEFGIHGYKKSDMLCEITKFYATKRKSSDDVIKFFCHFIKKAKDKGFQTICAKCNSKPDREGFVNYLNKAEFDAVFSAGSINGYTISENENGFTIDLSSNSATQ